MFHSSLSISVIKFRTLKFDLFADNYYQCRQGKVIIIDI